MPARFHRRSPSRWYLSLSPGRRRPVAGTVVTRCHRALTTTPDETCCRRRPTGATTISHACEATRMFETHPRPSPVDVAILYGLGQTDRAQHVARQLRPSRSTLYGADDVEGVQLEPGGTTDVGFEDQTFYG